MFFMDTKKTPDSDKILYITGYGDDENETIVYALTMPVSVRATIEKDGSLHVSFYEYTPDKPQFVCHTYAVPDATPPTKLDKLVCDKSLGENVAKTVAGWIATYMRDGVFCTDSKKETFLRMFDLRDVAERLAANMTDVYNKYRPDYD